MKRLFDIVAAAAGLIVLAPVIVVAALAIKLDSRGPVFFMQKRVGRSFRPFWIYKFRTMVDKAGPGASSITVGADPRITRVGHWLRKSKIDELPQLLNILRGDMTFVGPRPEVARYVELFRSDYDEILKVRPGLTDLASLKYRDEAALLGAVKNPEEEYLCRLLPDKIRLAKEYIRRASFVYDVGLIFKTLRALVERRSIA
jgi:lipopolysaccharide/colanic/teichoic acid biosynthesis glycosyltransferase